MTFFSIFEAQFIRKTSVSHPTYILRSIIDNQSAPSQTRKTNPQNLLPDPYYWAGNEPSLFSVFGFAHFADAGKGAAALQRHARYVMKHKYPLTPDGIPGNNDYGTMSAWYACVCARSFC